MSLLRHPDWHLVAEQRLRRRAALGESFQSFRGEGYLVIFDRATGQYLRLSERAQALWRALDGRQSVQQIWDRLAERRSGAPTQPELVDWILQLIEAGMVLSDHDLDPDDLSHRVMKKRSGRIEQRAAALLAVRVPLLDPQRIVAATYPFVAWTFSRVGAALLLLLALTALVAAIVNAKALAGTLDGVVSSQAGLASVALAYPLMKLLHELAHGWALHRHGGQIREFGAMLLVFFPVPYMEASEATALSDKRARMLVSAAGIIAEVTIAAVALLLWLVIEPGVVRALLFNLVLIGTVSTLAFNGNPLLKFDAYYVLADWLEVPNLASRASEWMSDRAIAGVCGLRSMVTSGPGEARIFALYGPASLIYRIVLSLTIALLVSTWFWGIGVALAMWSLVMGLIWPFCKTVWKGITMARRQNRRGRAAWRAGAALTVLVGLVVFVPLPFTVTGTGKIVASDAASVTAGAAGTVAEVLVQDRAIVQAGDPVLRLQDPVQSARTLSLILSLEAIDVRLEAPGLDVGERRRLAARRASAQKALDEAREREDAMLLRAPVAGQMAWLDGRLPTKGAYLLRGDQVGRVIAAGVLEVIVAMPPAYATRPRTDGGAAEGAAMRLLVPDGTAREVTVAAQQIADVGQPVPPALLSSQGGPVPESPNAPGTALRPVWVLRAGADADLVPWAGATVTGRLDLAPASLATQIAVQVQRLFLRVTRL